MVVGGERRHVLLEAIRYDLETTSGQLRGVDEEGTHVDKIMRERPVTLMRVFGGFEY